MVKDYQKNTVDRYNDIIVFGVSGMYAWGA